MAYRISCGAFFSWQWLLYFPLISVARTDTTQGALFKWCQIRLMPFTYGWQFWLLGLFVYVTLHHLFQMYVYLVLTDKEIKHFKCFQNLCTIANGHQNIVKQIFILIISKLLVCHNFFVFHATQYLLHKMYFLDRWTCFVRDQSYTMRSLVQKYRMQQWGMQEFFNFFYYYMQNLALRCLKRKLRSFFSSHIVVTYIRATASRTRKKIKKFLIICTHFQNILLTLKFLQREFWIYIFSSLYESIEGI